MQTLPTPQPTHRHHPKAETEGLERLLAFSDGVFAIAITLLVLDIRLPGIESPLTDAQLLEQLHELWPKFLAYLLSFLVVAIFWVKHHATFRSIKAYDSRLVGLNMLLLLVVSFIPFPTAVMSAQHNSVATVFYCLTMALGFALSAAISWHATRGDQLMSDEFDPPMRRAALVSAVIPCTVFVLSAALALVDARWAKLSLLLMIPAANSSLWSWFHREPTARH